MNVKHTKKKKYKTLKKESPSGHEIFKNTF